MELRCCLDSYPAIFLVVFEHLVGSGIYPDILHILDLAIYFDLFASAYLTWTDSPTIFPGRSRDDRLLGLYRRYLQWCVDNRNFTLSHPIGFSFNFYVSVSHVKGVKNNYFCTWGIPNGCRARPILFQSSTLQSSTTKYPVIGQKKLNGASSRLMIIFGASLATEIYQEHPTDCHRPGRSSLLPCVISKNVGPCMVGNKIILFERLKHFYFSIWQVDQREFHFFGMHQSALCWQWSWFDAGGGRRKHRAFLLPVSQCIQ